MKLVSLLTAAVALVLCACDRHQWEGENGVKELYKSPPKDAHGGHGKGHAEKADHKKSEEAH